MNHWPDTTDEDQFDDDLPFTETEEAIIGLFERLMPLLVELGKAAAGDVPAEDSPESDLTLPPNKR